jgi:putative DNA-invertase from lambdoid prophage Rac
LKEAVRDALISFMAATAQAQAEATKEAQRAGIDHAKQAVEKYRGRKPTFDSEQLSLVRDMIAKGDGASTIAKATSLSRQTVMRIRDAPAEAERALARWGR